MRYKETPPVSPGIVTGLSPLEEEVLEYQKAGKKLKEIAEILGRSLCTTRRILRSAKEKQAFLHKIHRYGQIWVGDIPDIPPRGVGALHRNGIFTVSKLLKTSDKRLKEMYSLGPKSMEVILNYKKSMGKT